MPIQLCASYGNDDFRLLRDDLISIGKMAYGSNEGTSGGAGNIGIINGKVVKFNTHIGERMSIKSSAIKAGMLESCNALKAKLAQMLVQLSKMSADRNCSWEGCLPQSELKKICDKLGFKQEFVNGKLDSMKYDEKSLLDRKTVAAAISIMDNHRLTGSDDENRLYIWDAVEKVKKDADWTIADSTFDQVSKSANSKEANCMGKIDLFLRKSLGATAFSEMKAARDKSMISYDEMIKCFFKTKIEDARRSREEVSEADFDKIFTEIDKCETVSAIYFYNARRAIQLLAQSGLKKYDQECYYDFITGLTDQFEKAFMSLKDAQSGETPTKTSDKEIKMSILQRAVTSWKEKRPFDRESQVDTIILFWFNELSDAKISNSWIEKKPEVSEVEPKSQEGVQKLSEGKSEQTEDKSNATEYILKMSFKKDDLQMLKKRLEEDDRDMLKKLGEMLKEDKENKEIFVTTKMSEEDKKKFDKWNAAFPVCFEAEDLL